MKIYQVDAFANELFKGNSAAIVPLESWLSEQDLQNIAMENNLSETAFFVPTQTGFHLRWFTPTVEVPLCGHATLAAAHVIFTHPKDFSLSTNSIEFSTHSGILRVEKVEENRYKMSFPALKYREIAISDFHSEQLQISATRGFESENFLCFLVENESEIKDYNPDFEKIKKLEKAVILTAKSTNIDLDFVSRFFAPNSGIDEDPVTGSAHCLLTPDWSEILQKDQFRAKQISQGGGILVLILHKDSQIVEISGEAKTYMEGQIFWE